MQKDVNAGSRICSPVCRMPGKQAGQLHAARILSLLVCRAMVRGSGCVRSGLGRSADTGRQAALIRSISTPVAAGAGRSPGKKAAGAATPPRRDEGCNSFSREDHCPAAGKAAKASAGRGLSLSVTGEGSGLAVKMFPGLLLIEAQLVPDSQDKGRIIGKAPSRPDHQR